MILAKDIKEIADVANQRKRRELEAALQSIYLNLASEVEEKIRRAAENGLYNVSIDNLYDKIESCIADGYNLYEAVSRLACMIQERFFECGFDVKIGEPTDDDCYCVYITWDKEPQKCAFGRATRA